MALKRRYTKKEDIPAGKEELYIEKDGAWILDVDAVEEIETLLRTVENVKGDKAKLQAKLAEYGDIDLEEARKLIADQQKNKDKKMIEEGKLDELLAQRTEAMRKGHETQTAKLTEQITKMQTRLAKELVDNRIMLEAKAAGVKAKAMDDVLLRGRSVFIYDPEQDAVLARDHEGKQRFGKDGKPLQPGDWIRGDLFETADHLFETGSGSGAPRGGGDGGGGGAQHTIKRSEARDPGKYQVAREAASKAGASLTIVD